jgi:hypothetical protein
MTRVAVDPRSAAIAYVTLSGFRDDEPLPHVFRTTDFGATWAAVSSNLPEMPVNDIVIDEDDPAQLYVATDAGIYVSTNAGGSWSTLGAGLPNGVVPDLELHAPTRTLIAGTYGRSLFTYDLGVATAIDEALAGAKVPMPRLRPAAPNPTRAGTDWHYELPGAAHTRLTIVDASGRLVRTLIDAHERAGAHHVHWDGQNAHGRPVSQGVYFARLEANGLATAQKVIITH